MKTGIVKVFSVLTHLRDAGDTHQFGGRDPWETEGKRSERWDTISTRDYSPASMAQW